MYKTLEKRVSGLLALDRALLRGRRVGLEKESLRVGPDGGVAQTPHPPALGSALTHPYITTDYSEALLEFITPPLAASRAALEWLSDIHKFVYQTLEDEILWATSMPCVLHGEENIPIAAYGNSNAGMMKTVYRRGLGHRYGRTMQVIAGVHFNFSLSDEFWGAYQALEGEYGPLREFASEAYFQMLRNLQRFGWLIPYLFGASPAVCKSFLCGKPRPASMEEFDAHTLFEPFGTSLRMGDIGYQNHREDEIGIKANYDSLSAYVDSLSCAINTPSPVYARMGVVKDGEWQQLNANILQIENEYYSTVRPKQPPVDNEKPSIALRRRGVQYVELRSLDVNTFEPLGIGESQLYFLEAFLLFCLLQESPRIGAQERDEIDINQNLAAHRGRDPALRLQRGGAELGLREWGLELCDALAGVCELLDRDTPDSPYSRAVALQRESVLEPERTPSARMLAEMRATGEGFYDFARRKSEEHQRYFLALNLAPERLQLFQEEARRSLARQAQIEAADDCSFEDYLRAYFAQAG